MNFVRIYGVKVNRGQASYRLLYVTGRVVNFTNTLQLPASSMWTRFSTSHTQRLLHVYIHSTDIANSTAYTNSNNKFKHNSYIYIYIYGEQPLIYWICSHRELTKGGLPVWKLRKGPTPHHKKTAPHKILYMVSVLVGSWRRRNEKLRNSYALPDISTIKSRRMG